MRNPASEQLDLFADAPRAARRRPKPPQLDEAQLEMKLAGARQRVRNLIVIGMNPGVPADTREAAHKMESWTRELVRVHSRVLADFRARQSRPRRLP
jgi:hypothetical protein